MAVGIFTGVVGKRHAAVGTAVGSVPVPATAAQFMTVCVEVGGGGVSDHAALRQGQGHNNAPPGCQAACLLPLLLLLLLCVVDIE